MPGHVCHDDDNHKDDDDGHGDHDDDHYDDDDSCLDSSANLLPPLHHDVHVEQVVGVAIDPEEKKILIDLEQIKGGKL